jgi:glycosyltransferase involved in cell wall biosynthesis
MKTINIIFPNYYKDHTAAHNRLRVYLNLLLKYSYKVNLFTLSREKYKKIEKCGDLTIYFVFQKKITKNNFFKRAYEEIMSSFNLIRMAKKIEADFNYLTIPSMFLLPLGKSLKNNIIDIRDIQWEYLDNKFIKKLLKNMMLISLRKYKKVIVTNEYEQKYLQDFSPIVIFNGIEEFKYKKIINLNYKFNNEVTYIGNIGIAQDLITLVKVARELPQIKFNIIGDGVEFDKIKNYIKKNNLKNVNLTGKLSWNDILKYYQNSKILFAQLKENFFTAIPSKLYEYASTGLPIVYGGKGEAINFVEKLENGYTFSPGDTKKCKLLIETILKKEIKLSNNNRTFIKENFIREKNALKLLTILEELRE